MRLLEHPGGSHTLIIIISEIWVISLSHHVKGCNVLGNVGKRGVFVPMGSQQWVDGGGGGGEVGVCGT